MAYRYLAAVIAALFLALCASRANAACSNPAAAEGNFIYNQVYHTYQYCDGTLWKSFADLDPAAGGAGCTNPAQAAGYLMYNDDFNVMQFCNGTNWIAVGQSSIGYSGSCGVTSGLVGHWKLDENTGTTAADASGSGNTGTLLNGPTWASGKVSNSLNFDGVDDYISVGTPSALSLSTTGTLSAWIKTNTSTFYPVIVGNADFVNDSRGYLLALDSSGHARIELCSASAFKNVDSSATYLDGNWHHITGTWDGTTIRLYVDGSEVASSSQDVTPVSGVYPVTMGKDPNQSTSYFVGLIDDVRIYNRALTVGEISQIYNSGAGCSD